MTKPSPTTTKKPKIKHEWFDDYHDITEKSWEEVSPEDYGYLWDGPRGALLYFGVKLPSKESKVSLYEYLENSKILIANHFETLYFSGELALHHFYPDNAKKSELEKKALVKISKTENKKPTHRTL